MSPPPALPASLASLLPKVGERLEEVAPEQGADFAAAFGFALSRLGERDDPRPLMLTAPQAWLSERGRPFAQGLAIDPSRLFLVAAAKESQALWALEEALKSGAVAGGMALAGQASFVMTRRLDFAAKSGCCAAILLRPSPPVDLSAAHLRWRIGSLISASDPDDPRAPGAARAMSCSGEPAVPTATSRLPRRTASAAVANVSSVPPLHETAITTSTAPTQPGS